jgi:hypothetical protein
MPIVYDDLMRLDLPEREFSYTERDAMLYALSVGMGQDPMDKDELPFVYEKDLKVLPGLATVIAWDDTWAAKTGINFLMVVHGEQRVTVHKPLPPRGRIKSKVRIKDAFDKGAGKGAILLSETTLSDAGTGERLVTLMSSLRRPGAGQGRRPAGAAQAARAPAGYGGHCAHAAEPGLVLPALRRPQSAACRSRCREGGRFPAPDPAWPVHLWTCGARRREGGLQSRPGADRPYRSALHRSGVSGRNDPYRDLEGRQCRLVPGAADGARRGGAQPRQGRAAGLKFSAGRCGYRPAGPVPAGAAP